MLIQLALRNITAYKKRSIVTVLLTTVTTCLLIFSTAWMDGSHKTMIENGVEIYPGYLQITGKEFRDAPSYDHLIFDARAVSRILAGNSDISVFAPRFESFVLFSAEQKAVGGMLTGIVPEQEQHLSRLASSLKTGAYLSSSDQAQVYMGNEFAKRLDLQVGDEVAFVGSGADYSFAADLLRVKGIFQTGLFDFDASSAFISKSYQDKIMATENYATHFIVLPKETELSAQLARELGTTLGHEYQVASWDQTMASLVKAMQLDSMFGYITLGIIFIVIFFVIMIYTLLAIYARIREIGVLRAIGTSPGQVLSMLLLESGILSLLSVLMGGLIGAALAWYFNVHPIVFTGYEEQFKQYGLAASAMPTDFAPLIILRDMVVMFVLSMLSTLYPIFKVNGLVPVEAINHV